MAPSAVDHRCCRTRGRWAAVREPVLDATGAALLWTAMAVDLATRPLAAGQSASTPAAYLWAALIAGPFAVHRRFPVIAMLCLDLALIGYCLGPLQRVPRVRDVRAGVRGGAARRSAPGVGGVPRRHGRAERRVAAAAAGRGDRVVVDQYPAHRHGGLAGRGEPEGPPGPTPPRARRGPPPGRAATLSSSRPRRSAGRSAPSGCGSPATSTTSWPIR